MFFQEEKHISWASLFHSATATAKKISFHTSNAEWGNRHASIVCLYLSSQHLTGIIVLGLICFPVLSQVSEIMLSVAYHYGTQAALQSCTLCLGEKTAALKLSMTDPEAAAGTVSPWDLEEDLGVHVAQKSSSCCSSGSCCLCHRARDTGTTKINIWPVTRVILTLGSGYTWNPLRLGPEKKRCVEFTFRNCPTGSSSLLSFPICQQDEHWVCTENPTEDSECNM